MATRLKTLPNGFKTLTKWPAFAADIAASELAASLTNKKRRPYVFQPGDKVLVKHSLTTKTSPRFTGPFTVSEVTDNNTLLIILNDGSLDRINIRKVKPFREGQDVVPRRH